MDITLVVITLGAFAASFVNAAFATGGVYVLLLSALAVLPASTAIPLQSPLSAGSLAARIGLFWHDIQWRIVATFVFGCLFGVYFGARAFVAASDALLQMLLGILLMALIWLPKTGGGWKVKHPFAYVGVVHSFVGTMFGVGGVLQSVIIRTDLRKVQITGTLAACMIALDVMKMTSYVGFGFRYQDYIPHIVLATFAGFAGTWIGKRATVHVSETAFRTVFRWLITLVALRLVYRGWTVMAA
ncbi:sulfite exporter TauE/SafE family protein [Oricola nitratireducens]|uniref:sulfite exporter TauE/SafE family protein n=1 Tax=Oricola nitratireducens TaxID=2775868 RepID=UPI00186726CE|nr:sulfite exporter TauE/SafE family protein [Oricola nitratireducens]